MIEQCIFRHIFMARKQKCRSSTKLLLFWPTLSLDLWQIFFFLYQTKKHAGQFWCAFCYLSSLSKDLWRNGRNTPKNCIFWKYIVGGWFFAPWTFIIPKSSYRDLSNEGSKFFFEFTGTCFLSCSNMGIFG